MDAKWVRGLTLFAMTVWLSAGIANAQKELTKADEVFRAGAAKEPPLSRLVIRTEFIEVDTQAYAAWSADPKNTGADPELRAHIQKLIKEGKAKHRDLNVVVTRSGERAETESSAFLIHPSEFDPPIAAENGSATTPAVMAATECRNLGFTTSCDAVLGSDGKTVDINLSPQIVTEDGESRYGTAEAEVAYPRFGYLHAYAHVTVSDGEPALITVLSEENPESSAPPATVLVFVTADVHQP